MRIYWLLAKYIDIWKMDGYLCCCNLYLDNASKCNRHYCTVVRKTSIIDGNTSRQFSSFRLDECNVPPAILLDITKNHYMSEAVHSNYQIEGSRNKSLARRFLVWTRFHRRQMSWWYSPSLHHYPKSQRRGELSPCWVIVAAFRVCTCHNFLSDSVADNRLAGWGPTGPALE